MSSSLFAIKRFKIIFIICWLVIIADQALVVYWFGQPWKVAAIDSLISNAILFPACLLVMNTLRYYLPQRERYINLLTWCVFLTVVVTLLSKWALSSAFYQNEGYLSFLRQSLPVRISLDFLLLGCIILMSVVWYNMTEQQESEKRKQDAEKLSRDAELFKLRQQMQPHFLFNSLNSINALIGSQPQQARKMVQQLSDFLRGTLKKDEQQWVSLDEELEYLQLYLDIEKVRFGNRLSTAIETEKTAGRMKLPALLLQPLVENAIKFGLYDTTGEIEISIKSFAAENELIIEVQNPFDPATSSPRQGTGFGLSSIQRRLYLLFARNDLLTTKVKENIFTTTVKIPQHD